MRLLPMTSSSLSLATMTAAGRRVQQVYVLALTLRRRVTCMIIPLARHNVFLTSCHSNGTTIYTFNKYIEDAVNSLQAKSAKVIVSSQTPDNPFNTSFSPSRFVGYAETAAEESSVLSRCLIRLIESSLFITTGHGSVVC